MFPAGKRTNRFIPQSITLLLTEKNESSRYVPARAKYLCKIPKFENIIRDESNLDIITNNLH